MKYKNLLYTVAIIYTLFMINGCASNGALHLLQPLEVNLTGYESMVVSISSNFPGNEKSQLESLIISKLRAKQLFEKVYSGEAAPNTDKALQMKGVIIEIKKVDAGSRMMLGALAGQARVLVNVSLIDLTANKIIGEFNAEGKSSGGSIFAGTTSQALDQAADQIVNLIQTEAHP